MSDDKQPTIDEQLEEIRERIGLIEDALVALKEWTQDVISGHEDHTERLRTLEGDLRKRMPMR